MSKSNKKGKPKGRSVSAMISDDLRVLNNAEKCRIGKRNGKAIVFKSNEPDTKILRSILEIRDSLINQDGQTENINPLKVYKKRVDAHFKPIYATNEYSDTINGIKWFICGVHDKNGNPYNIRNHISDECEAYKAVGLFRRIALKHCPNARWLDDVEAELYDVYYIARANGFTVGYARHLAKIRAYPAYLEYSQRAKKYYSSYRARERCTCSECYRKRPENCLNGTYEIQFETLLYLDHKFGRIFESGQDSLILHEILITSENVKTAKDGKIGVENFLKRITKIAKDETDLVIINGMIWGETQTELEKMMNISRREIKRRLLLIGKRYQKQYLKPILDNGKTVLYSRSDYPCEMKVSK